GRARQAASLTGAAGIRRAAGPCLRLRRRRRHRPADPNPGRLWRQRSQRASRAARAGPLRAPSRRRQRGRARDLRLHPARAGKIRNGIGGLSVMSRATSQRLSSAMLLTLCFALALGSYWVLEIMRKDGQDAGAALERSEPDYFVDNFRFV